MPETAYEPLRCSRCRHTGTLSIEREWRGSGHLSEQMPVAIECEACGATWATDGTVAEPDRRADCMAVGAGIAGTTLLCDRAAGHDGAHHCPVSGATWGERPSAKPDPGASS
jgi:hypothetical protein